MYLLHKFFLPLRIVNVQYFQGSICFELKFGGKTCNFLSPYRSLSQSQDKFEILFENLEVNLENLIQRNLFLVIAIVHLNAKSSNWFSQNKASSEGNKIENLTFQFGLLQVTKETTHTLDISFLCTGLIFTPQPNLIIESEIHPSLPSKNYLVFKTS